MAAAKDLATVNRWPDVNRVTVADIGEVLALGVRDFKAAPQYGFVFGGIYAIAGWAVLGLIFWFEVYYLAYPLAMGFALIAPFASVGFYSVSHRLEAGKPLSWSAVFGDVREAARHDLRWMALITGFTFFAWVDYAAIIFLAMMGFQNIGWEIVTEVFTTPKGWLFLFIGHIAGARIAIVVFSVSVVTYPMLYHRDIDFVTAIMTSVRLVFKNPVAMLVWCATLAVLTAAALLPLFLGLFIFLPVAGHASWHLYRRAVGPDKVATAAAD